MERVNRLAIIHTTAATVDSLKALAAEYLPGHQLLHIVDESVLPELAANGGDLSTVEDRLLAYARMAEQAGATILLEACSSVGDVVEKMRQTVSIPVVRIDSPMAEEAVRRAGRLAGRIGVAATLPTTLAPTTRLLEAQARAAGSEIALESLLIQGAFEKLSAGDRAGHDALLVEGLSLLAQKVDVVVLAQASMARVLPQLPEADREKILTSPRLAMERVQAVAANSSPTGW